MNFKTFSAAVLVLGLAFAGREGAQVARSGGLSIHQLPLPDRDPQAERGLELRCAGRADAELDLLRHNALLASVVGPSVRQLPARYGLRLK